MAFAADDPTTAAAPPATVALRGDARLLLTAPIVCRDRVLGRAATPWRTSDRLAPAGDLDLGIRGSLTFGEPVLRGVVGGLRLGDELCPAICAAANAVVGAGDPCALIAACDVDGLVFEDGIVTVAVLLHVPGGWDEHRGTLLRAFGPEGRDAVAARIRVLLLDAVGAVVRDLDGHPDGELDLPYFNLTYAGETAGPRPGLGALGDEERGLVYPHTPGPLGSASPLVEEHFYAGYAYSVLAHGPGATATLRKLRSLLLVLGYQYARLARGIDAVDERFAAVRRGDLGDAADDLDTLELQLSADFQELAAPTFSFDHHALVLRDAVLAAWSAERLYDRCRFVLGALAEFERRRLAEVHARGVRRLNRVVLAITALSIVASAEAAYNLIDKLT